MIRIIYYGTHLSPHMTLRDPEGYLICHHVPVARTGTQRYLPAELDLPRTEAPISPGAEIPVLRPAEEVFSPACMASFEGMPVTDDHPGDPGGVNTDNIRYLQRGHAQNVRRGTGGESDLLLADLVITDPDTIRRVLDGKREISCGYNYTLCLENGQYVQRDIRGNHIAIVREGRAGPRVSIQDRRPTGAPAASTPDARDARFPVSGDARAATYHHSLTPKGANAMRKTHATRKATDAALMRRMLSAYARDEQADPLDVAAAAGLISAMEREQALREADEEPAPAEAETRAVCGDEDTEAPEAPAAYGQNETAEHSAARNPDGAAGTTATADEDPAPALATRLLEKLDALITRLADLAPLAARDEEDPALPPADTFDPATDEFTGTPAAAAAFDPATGMPVAARALDPLTGLPVAPALDDDPAIPPADAAAAGDTPGNPLLTSALQALMPVVAAMPEENRKAASDAMIRALRVNAGLSPMPSANAYAAIRARRAADARRGDPTALGRRIMATRNVNMRK